MSEPENTVVDQLRQRCGAGPLSYRDYIDIVLYAEGGYYRRPEARVGRAADRDFYTAESLGPVFARLVATAAEDLLPEGTASDHQFIEIAAEPGAALLDQWADHPFASQREIRLGDPHQVSGPVVLFANEWLDALPFHRLIFEDGRWRELGVAMEGDQLREVRLEELTAPVAAAAERLPARHEEGYRLDLPLAAEAALAQLLEQEWTGLLLLLDYGKTEAALLEDCPGGTARTYHRHEAGNDLLAEPGQRDITCHICWDPLERQLQAAGFRPVCLESQESFLVQRGARAAEAIIAGAGDRFSTDRQTLMQLVHPANMGQKFQVLWGLRRQA